MTGSAATTNRPRLVDTAHGANALCPVRVRLSVARRRLIPLAHLQQTGEDPLALVDFDRPSAEKIPV
jgi:hypothetical protein